MGMKKKLGMGVASLALGLSLVGGGTYAYFNDVETTNNTFAAGTLDLSVNPGTIIEANNIKPGDWMNRTFELKNDGSLDISKVMLTTDYEVEGVDKDADDLGEHIKVNFLKNQDKSGVMQPNNIIYETTLAELKDMKPDAVEKNVFAPLLGEKSGLKSGDSDALNVRFEFMDNEEDQNAFQDASLKLKWDFEAKQTKGTSK